MRAYLTDDEALYQIKNLMSGKEWSPDMLDAIAEIVRATGREIKDLNHEDPEEPEPPKDPLVFCRELCGGLTDAQETVVIYHVLKRTFLGVGFPLGKTYRVPLVSFNWAWDNVAAIDKNGNRVMAADHGRVMYEVNDNEGTK
jgi:hypothetical protein